MLDFKGDFMKSFHWILIIACSSLLTLSCASISQGAEWKFYYQTEVEKDGRKITQKLYYDDSSVEQAQKGIVRVALKTVKVIGNENESDLTTKVAEINCSSRKYRYLVVTELEEETGKVLSEEKTPDAPWTKFGYESAAGGLSANVCYAKKVSKETAKKPDEK